MAEEMKVSVVIPVYNLASCVRATLDSVVAAAEAAPAVELEVLCVDDGSTDASPAILDAFFPALASRPPTLSFRVLHKPNGGEGSARNAGMAVATGDWLAFLDGDDVWLPNFLVRAAAAVEEHPDADVVGFRFAPFDDGGEPPAVPAEASRTVRYDTRESIPSEAILGVGVFPTLFRRGLFSALAFSALPLGADRLYVAACLARAKTVVLSDEVVHGYRIREGSMARAAWDARKVTSMIDYAAGSLGHLSASGKRIGRAGAAYLADVLTSVAAKHVRRLTDGKDAVRRHWTDALRSADPVLFPGRRRLMRRWVLWYNSAFT